MFAILTLAFLLTDNEHLQVVAGAMFVIIGLFKGITALMFLPVLCAALLLRSHTRLYWLDLVGGWLAAVVAFFALNATIWPHMLSDMLMSAQVARVGMYPWYLYLLSNVGYLLPACYYIPLLGVSLFLGLLIGLRYLAIDTKQGALFAAMWAVPFGIVFMQGEFFIYQYYVLMFPAIVTLVLWGRLA